MCAASSRVHAVAPIQNVRPIARAGSKALFCFCWYAVYWIERDSVLWIRTWRRGVQIPLRHDKTSTRAPLTTEPRAESRTEPRGDRRAASASRGGAGAPRQMLDFAARTGAGGGSHIVQLGPLRPGQRSTLAQGPTDHRWVLRRTLNGSATAFPATPCNCDIAGRGC
jgi:hypothetical protein